MSETDRTINLKGWLHKMDLTLLNPVIRSASLYDRIGNKDHCIGYDSRIIYVISGDIKVTCEENAAIHLTPGHMLYIPAGMTYRLRGKYLRAVVVTFDPTSDMPLPEERLNPVLPSNYNPELLHSVADCPPLDKMIHIEDMESEKDSFLKLVNLFTSEEGTYRAQASAVLKLLILKIIDTVDNDALSLGVMEELNNYILEHICEEISNTEIGAIFGYHPFYISKVLKEKKGQTLRQYIIAYRLKLAKKLLSDSEKEINMLAEECGFNDASYFTKIFKHHFGMTPKEFRNLTKNEFI